MKALVKVEKNGIAIPIDKLKGINESDILEIQIEKVYISKKDKKALFNA